VPYLLKVYVIGQFHVLRMNAENLKTACGIRNTNVNLTVETPKSTEGRIDRVWPIGSSHDDDIGSSLQTIHKGEQLRYNATLDFTIRLSQYR